MTTRILSTLSFVAHVVVFALSALSCLASIPRARKIQDRGTREGFVGLLLAVGVWAIGYVGYLVAPLDSVRLAFYLLGINSGFVSVGAFLYLCAAYTGRPPRHMPYRRVAGGAFLLVLLLKFTNPIHHLFFTTSWATDPFPHLAIQHTLLYWVVLGLSYAVTAVGFFMLLERLYHTGTDTRPLVVLLGLTGLPAGATILAGRVPSLLPLMYEPPGVAIFAVGTLFVYFRRFETVQLTAETEAPAIFLDRDERLRDYNRAAVELLPALEGSLGKPIDSVSPRVADALDETTGFVEIENENGDGDGDGNGTGSRVYRVSSSPFLSGEIATGRLITFADITERERYRRELEQTNERLEEFASVISHDLRNPLNVAQGWVELARTERDTEHLEHVVRAHARIEALIDDLLTLAREGEQVGEREAVDVADVTTQCWQTVETARATVVLRIDRSIRADRSRFRQLLENLVRNAIEHGGDDVTVTVGELPDRDGFYVADDGPGIPEGDREEVFDAGYSTAEDGTGFGLSIVKQIAGAHGWDIRVTEGTDGGARFEIRGVEFVD